MVLVELKHQEWIEGMDTSNFIGPESTKWGKIAKKLDEQQVFLASHDAHACKYKWATLLGDYKKVLDHHKGTEIASEEYFALRYDERKLLGLYMNFDKDIYRTIHEWLKDKSTMQPIHARDLLDPQDGIYVHPTVEFGDEISDEEYGSDLFKANGVKRQDGLHGVGMATHQYLTIDIL